MGIKTVIDCDACGRNLGEEDYISIESKFEFDHNRMDMADERHRQFGIFCEACGRKVWETITGINTKEES